VKYAYRLFGWLVWAIFFYKNFGCEFCANICGDYFGNEFYLHQCARRDLVKILLTGEQPQKNYGH